MYGRQASREKAYSGKKLRGNWVIFKEIHARYNFKSPMKENNQQNEEDIPGRRETIRATQMYIWEKVSNENTKDSSRGRKQNKASADNPDQKQVKGWDTGFCKEDVKMADGDLQRASCHQSENSTNTTMRLIPFTCSDGCSQSEPKTWWGRGGGRVL